MLAAEPPAWRWHGASNGAARAGQDFRVTLGQNVAHTTHAIMTETIVAVGVALVAVVVTIVAIVAIVLATPGPYTV